MPNFEQSPQAQLQQGLGAPQQSLPQQQGFSQQGADSNGMLRALIEQLQQRSGDQQQQGSPQQGAQPQAANRDPMQALFEQLIGQAQPRAYQPEGYPEASGQAQLKLIDQYLGEIQGGYAPQEEYLRRQFNEETLPQILGGFRGDSSARDTAKQRALERLENSLQAGRGQYRVQALGGLGNYLQGQQQVGQQQQQAGLQGLGQLQNFGQTLSNQKIQLIQQLLGGQKAQVSGGLGQGGDQAEVHGAVPETAKLAESIASLVYGFKK